MFYVRFRGRSCQTFSAEVKIRSKASELWTYADLAAPCGIPAYDKSAKPYSLLNPQVIFEVLSPSTASFDRRDKFERYKQIESLTDCVLVASESMRLEHYLRQEGGGWLYREYHESTDDLKLASVGVELPLSEVYERVEFPEPDTEVRSFGRSRLGQSV